MKHTLLPISALLMSVALLLTANGLIGVLLPLRAVLLGFAPFDIGVMGTAYYAGFFAGCLFGPRLMRRVGHIRTFAALVSIICTAILLHGLFDSTYVWWLARALTGLCFAISYIVIESWLNAKATNDNRGLIFSIYTIISLTVITLGQLAITLASVNEFVLFACAAILVSIAILPVAISIAEAPLVPATISVRMRYLFERSHVAIIACCGVGMANGAFWTLGPVYAQSLSSDTATTAMFMSITVIAGALGQWPLGRLSDRVDRRRVIVGASAGASVGAIILVTVTPSGPLTTYFGAALFGAFAFPLYALCAAHLNDFVEDDGYVEAASGLLMAYAAGAIIGPLIASAVMNSYGARSLFVYSAAIHLAIAVFTLYRLRVKTAIAPTDRAPFSDALVMTSMAADIDPRSEPTEEN